MKAQIKNGSLYSCQCQFKIDLKEGHVLCLISYNNRRNKITTNIGKQQQQQATKQPTNTSCRNQ